MDELLFGHQIIEEYSRDNELGYPVPPKDVQRIIFRYAASNSYKACIAVRRAR